jgi:hypothetical protein
MTTQRNAQKRRVTKESLGLAAIGSVGGWEVALDETTSAARRWFLQIEGPSVSVSFEVESPYVIDKMLAFLAAPGKAGPGAHRNSSPRTSELVIGKSAAEPVTLLRDDEFPDRFFLVAETARKLIVRITLGGEDLRMLESALSQSKEDLDDEDAD